MLFSDFWCYLGATLLLAKPRQLLAQVLLELIQSSRYLTFLIRALLARQKPTKQSLDWPRLLNVSADRLLHPLVVG